MPVAKGSQGMECLPKKVRIPAQFVFLYASDLYLCICYFPQRTKAQNKHKSTLISSSVHKIIIFREKKCTGKRSIKRNFLHGKGQYWRYQSRPEGESRESFVPILGFGKCLHHLFTQYIEHRQYPLI